MGRLRCGLVGPSDWIRHLMGTADGDKDPLSAYSRYSHHADRETVEAFEEVAKSSLENVRKNAADWRSGLSGLLAIVTTSAALKTGNDILQYTPPTRILLGLVSLFSILPGGVGLWFLVVAAHGNVKRITITEVMEAGGMLAWKSQKLRCQKILNRGKISYSNFCNICAGRHWNCLVWTSGKSSLQCAIEYFKNGF